MIGRGSAGVRLFNVSDNEHVVSAVRLAEAEAETEGDADAGDDSASDDATQLPTGE